MGIVLVDVLLVAVESEGVAAQLGEHRSTHGIGHCALLVGGVERHFLALGVAECHVLEGGVAKGRSTLLLDIECRLHAVSQVERCHIVEALHFALVGGGGVGLDGQRIAGVDVGNGGAVEHNLGV